MRTYEPPVNPPTFRECSGCGERIYSKTPGEIYPLCEECKFWEESERRYEQMRDEECRWNEEDW